MKGIDKKPLKVKSKAGPWVVTALLWGSLFAIAVAAKFIYDNYRDSEQWRSAEVWVIEQYFIIQPSLPDANTTCKQDF